MINKTSSQMKRVNTWETSGYLQFTSEQKYHLDRLGEIDRSGIKACAISSISFFTKPQMDFLKNAKSTANSRDNYYFMRFFYRPQRHKF